MRVTRAGDQMGRTNSCWQSVRVRAALSSWPSAQCGMWWRDL